MSVTVPIGGCCCPGECSCCPSQVCVKKFKFEISNIDVTLFGANYTPSDTVCLTTWFDGNTGGYLRYAAIELATGVWLGIRLAGSITCDNPAPADTVTWSAQLEWFIVDSGLGQEGNGSKSWGESAQQCNSIETEVSEHINEVMVQSQAPGCGVDPSTGTFEADILITDGDCGDGSECCEHTCTAGVFAGLCGQSCCNNGLGWFCYPDAIDASTYTITDVSGACFSTGDMTTSRLSINGVCVMWQFPFSSGFPSAVFGQYLTCDGDLYGRTEPVSPPCAVAGSMAYDWQLIGGVSTIHSCDPLDFEVTVTAGPCSGSVFRVTE